MDCRFECIICRKVCGNLPNYEAHVLGREHIKKLTQYVDLTTLPPPLPAQQVMMGMISMMMIMSLGQPLFNLVK